MFKIIFGLLVSAGLAFGAVGKLQNVDFATSAQITGAGGVVSQLLNTSKIYDSTNSQLLDTTIAAKQPTLSTSAAVANQFLTAFTAPNTFSRAQPAFTDLSGNATNAQLPTYTNHGVLLGTGAAGIAATAVGATNTVLHGNTGADPSYSAIVNADITNATIDLTTKVTGILPDANLPAPVATAISAADIDWSTNIKKGGMYTKTLAANTTFTFSSKATGQTIVVRLTNTASNFTVTWPTVKWSGGTAPTQTIGAKSDVYTFIFDGTDVFGSAVQNF